MLFWTLLPPEYWPLVYPAVQTEQPQSFDRAQQHARDLMHLVLRHLVTAVNGTAMQMPSCLLCLRTLHQTPVPISSRVNVVPSSDTTAEWSTVVPSSAYILVLDDGTTVDHSADRKSTRLNS